MMMKNA